MWTIRNLFPFPPISPHRKLLCCTLSLSLKDFPNTPGILSTTQPIIFFIVPACCAGKHPAPPGWPALICRLFFLSALFFTANSFYLHLAQFKQTVAQFGGQLKVKGFGRLQHLLFQVLRQRFGVFGGRNRQALR